MAYGYEKGFTIVHVDPGAGSDYHRALAKIKKKQARRKAAELKKAGKLQNSTESELTRQSRKVCWSHSKQSVKIYQLNITSPCLKCGKTSRDTKMINLNDREGKPQRIKVMVCSCGQVYVSPILRKDLPHSIAVITVGEAKPIAPKKKKKKKPQNNKHK